MAKLTREDFIASLKEMTILEIKDLVDAMKEEFGVDPSAVAVAAAPAAAVDEGPTEVTVTLTSAGATKIPVIKVIRDIGYGTGKEAIRVLSKCPKWLPGEQNGKKVRVLYSLPITIQSAE